MSEDQVLAALIDLRLQATNPADQRAYDDAIAGLTRPRKTA